MPAPSRKARACRMHVSSVSASLRHGIRIVSSSTGVLCHAHRPCFGGRVSTCARASRAVSVTPHRARRRSGRTRSGAGRRRVEVSSPDDSPAPEAADEVTGTEDVAVVRRRLRRATALCWVWTFAAFTVWSLATPAVDEPGRAGPRPDGLPRRPRPDDRAHRRLRRGRDDQRDHPAPQGLVESAATVDCYRYQWTPANCLAPPTDDDTMVTFVNPAGRNMPTYYLATGWPSLLVVSVPTPCGPSAWPRRRSRR